MPKPIRVKAVKAAGGPPTEDELDQLEALLGLGVKTDPAQVQRLIEALRTKASPQPFPPEAPTPRLRRRVVSPEPPPEPVPRYQAAAPPPRRKRRRQHSPPPPERKTSIFGTLVLSFVLLGIGTPMISFLVSTLAISTGQTLTARAVGIVDAVTVGMLSLLIIGSVWASRRSPPSRDSPAPEPDYDDEEEDDDGYHRYRDERWQGDNDLNGRNYSGRAI